MNRDDLGKYFVDERNEVYKMIAYCEEPTITLKRVCDDEKIEFAEGSRLARSFTRLIPDLLTEEVKENEKL